MPDRQGSHDALTGLITGALVPLRIRLALEQRSRQGGRVAVGFLGLDRFKRVNESMGHSGGDDLLRQVAARLARELRVGDSLGRYSGDEFTIVWSSDVPADSLALGQRMLDCLAEPFDVGGSRFCVTASLGIATAYDVPDPDTLLLGAAAAMGVAKSRGGNRVQELDDDLLAESNRRMEVETDLRVALMTNELALHYQPVIELDTGRPVGVEALVRWRRADGTLVPPDDFIPVAESSGLILEMGRWVLAQACHDAAGFTGPAAALHVAVNMSARELGQPGVTGHLVDALEASGLDATRLFIEVTESALMANEALAEQTLNELTAMGVHIAIDDFGTGYSSLLYLRRYPITELKVDRAFVAGIGTSPDDEAICRSVVSLAHSLHLTAVAEGVETREQAAELRSYGCQYAQGWLWSPAVPVSDLNATLTALMPPSQG